MDEKRLRLILFLETRDLGKAKEAYRFINGDEKPKPLFVDGVYVIYKNGIRELFTGENAKENVKCLGVKLGDHAVGVSLKGLKGRLPYDKDYYVCEYSSYKLGEIPAMFDFDGKANTEHLKAQGNFEFGLGEDEWIPSVGELAMIYEFKGTLNRALSYFGGDTIPNCRHWSSSESCATGAWYIGFSNGHLNLNSKNNSNSVRAVCAF